jgi:predicted SAM-dependent methyltransferase
VISRRTKVLYFAAMLIPMRISAWGYKAFLAPRSGNQRTVKVHLGPGRLGYKPGWINVDANLISARIDVWADLRCRLPFHDDSVDFFYSHHVIEHLPDSRLPFHFGEMHRCLKPGGVIRVGGPNGDEACRNFLAGNHGWFSDFPDKRKSIGGRLVNFLLCRGEHLTILTRSYLGELLSDAGFEGIAFRAPATDTGYPERLADALSGESEPTPESPHTLLVEAVKPRVRS